ncbi:MAG: DUF3107 domain-containing protein [Actinobacteria bacterium]|jgi:hypothetical protein|nr:DUF3107 domain-containing protein [Ilumatobacteraceae bacterium]MBU6242041.1 DUF3107 family protein [Acidobacteriota bacterium]NBN89975.1 DUF3107 domain-containing protein [Actinomycetota bacterium]NBP52873.1 DUF3107 domain-containing protein [Actinomycetota bacterium]
MEIRIGMSQVGREVVVDVDDANREELKAAVGAALSGATDTLWITDKKGREVAVPGAKIAFVEFGSPESARKIGFGD